MERLKNSIIKKSKLVSDRSSLKFKKTRMLNSKEAILMRIYKMVLNTYGGQLHNFLTAYAPFNEVFTLTHQIKGIVERLTSFLKRRELRGVAKIFFKNGRLVLELILSICRIDITYSLFSEGVNTQVIVITTTL
jgi:hypothetical protein